MKVSKEAMKDMYLRMVRIREFESKAQSLFADGKIPGFVHLYLGEEAVATGVCACLRDDDYITSTHRGHGHIVAKGGDLKFMMAERRSNMELNLLSLLSDGVISIAELDGFSEELREKLAFVLRDHRDWDHGDS